MPSMDKEYSSICYPASRVHSNSGDTKIPGLAAQACQMVFQSSLIRPSLRLMQRGCFPTSPRPTISTPRQRRLSCARSPITRTCTYWGRGQSLMWWMGLSRLGPSHTAVQGYGNILYLNTRDLSRPKRAELGYIIVPLDGCLTGA